MPLSLRDFTSPARVDAWLAESGATPAPVTRAGVRTALQFFATHMPTLPVDDALHFLRAMDLSRPVSAPTLAPGTPLVAFRQAGEPPFKLFYARPGASAHSSGINHNGRSLVRFKVKRAAPALESFTSGVIDVWTLVGPGQPTHHSIRHRTTTGVRAGVMAAGGGAQLVIPNSKDVLDVVP